MDKFVRVLITGFSVLFFASSCGNENSKEVPVDGGIATSKEASDEIKIAIAFDSALSLNGEIAHLVRPSGRELEPIEKVMVSNNRAVFRLASTELELLYVKFSDSLNKPFVPLITDSSYLKAVVDSNWLGKFNSEENKRFAMLTKYIRENQNIGQSIDGLIYLIDSLSPSFAAFSVMMGLRLNQSHPDQLSSISDKYTSAHAYANEWKSRLPPANLRVGSVAPNFELTDVSGQPIELKDLRGKYVLIDFWATWCGPCMREMPNVRSLYEEYRNSPFEILGVSLDNNKNAWKTIVSKKNLDWIHVIDSKGSNSVASRYAVSGIPYTYLIDPDGVIVAKNLRGHTLQTKLEGLFKK